MNASINHGSVSNVIQRKFAVKNFTFKVWSSLSGPFKLFLIIGSLFALYLLYGTYAEKNARHDARLFCAQIQIGDLADNLLTRAISAGANSTATKWSKIEGQPGWLPVTFIGLPPYSRYICAIESVGGKVSKAEFKHFD